MVFVLVVFFLTISWMPLSAPRRTAAAGWPNWMINSSTVFPRDEIKTFTTLLLPSSEAAVDDDGVANDDCCPAVLTRRDADLKETSVSLILIAFFPTLALMRLKSEFTVLFFRFCPATAAAAVLDPAMVVGSGVEI